MNEARRRVVEWSPPTPPPPEWSGLQAVQAVADGTLPEPPFAKLFGLSVSHVEPELVRVALTPAEFHYNPIGMVHGGVAATLLETALAATVRTTLPPGRTCVTMEMKVSYIRALTAATGIVMAEARVVHAGRQVAMAEGRITDANGRLYATASSTCLVIEAAAARHAAAPGERRRVIEWVDPIAHARELAGKPGLEALRERTFLPPIASLVGLDMVSVDRGCVGMTVPPDESLFSQFGAVHGGVTATLLDSVMGCAVHTTLTLGRAYTTLEIKVTFLRAMSAEAGLITATGQVLHEGRRMVAAEGRAVDAKGRLCATATTTCLVFDARSPA